MMSSALDGASLVVRFDDVRTVSPRLAQVWAVLERHDAPLNLEVVPGWLDEGGAVSLSERAKRSHVSVSVHQHGADHVNHGTDKRRFEFDDSRGVDTQFADIQRGRALLEASLPDLFEPVFSPPWNRYGASTLEALVRAGFSLFSSFVRADAPTHPSVVCIPMTVDPVRWRHEPKHQPWIDTLGELVRALERDGYAGLELHHEVMTDEDIEELDRLLETLRVRGVRYPPMIAIAERARCK